ncbi:PREDICTED: retinitis pigmentosa 1-like 1 protein [Elephantulus edwardii]|uniref:retinitis pigmentosa 1-like 1 protein n=1 Tax=Elephantulus edwardii TaxID=28737 RepID=UPI0003F05E12|nr:PREDICTED: retinitis pigmentosa 1-like 1 protein [Elephantulus edwardii]
MTRALRDAQAPSYRECLLPSAARTSSIIQVTPAKKITFFKRGDPQFSGVRLAVHQRAFKSFSALMDELSQRVPLSFGVRSVTTPRGLHCLSTLEQLEDGGCYLCSDKKPPHTPNGPGRQHGKGPTTQPSGDFEGQYEEPGTPSSLKGPKASRRIMLVKNTNPRCQRTVLLSHRNTRSLPAFLSKASDLLHFPVKQVFTLSGKKVDSLQGLHHGPSVLVCAGHESFRPLVMENSKKNGTETVIGLTSRNKNGSWGLKTKQSIIHSRSKSGNRSRQFSLMSEKSDVSEPPVSLPHTCMGSVLRKHLQDTHAHLGPLVADDDFEKKVHMNEDGSLSVEMKVRFHLLSEDTLLWSTGVRKASTVTTASGGHRVPGEVDPLHCVWEGNPGDFSDHGALGQRSYVSRGEKGAEGHSSSLSSCASAQRRKKKQKRQASTVPSPNTSDSGNISQRSHQIQHHQRDTHYPLDSPYPLGSSSATFTPVSNSEPHKTDCASSFYPSHFTSAETEEDPETKGKIAGEEESLKEQGDDDVMMPSALPHLSPEAVICDWLSHIPEEPILMKYEMMDENSSATMDGSEDTQEDPPDKHSLKGHEKLPKVREQPLEGKTNVTPRLDVPLGTEVASPKPEETSSHRGASRGVSDAHEEARASKRTTVNLAVHENVLPNQIPPSIHIMKTLISSKQDRPSSMPEVSDVVGRRLSHSASDLVTCLARLHFFDEDHGSPVSKVRFTDSPRFQELLATFQSLWPQHDKLDLGLQKPKSDQTLPGSTHPVTEDFTPTSSSGVDVSSGSAGSGEGNVPCPVDCALATERIEVPLEMVTSIVSPQKPDSSTSENPEDLRNQHQNCSNASSHSQDWACTTRQDETGEDNKEVSNSLEQEVENMMQEDEVQEEKTQEEIDKEWKNKHSKEEEFPKEERVDEQELPEDGIQDGEGTPEGTRMQKEEAERDPDLVDPCSPGLRGRTIGPSDSSSERDSCFLEHARGPTFETALEKSSRSADMVSEQTQVNFLQGMEEKNSSMVHRASLDPDPIWVFNLLKKMERTFMMHFVSATTALRARWGLQNHDLLDQMVAELHEDVSRRLQDSVKQELGKIQSRAARKEPRPPREAMRRETSLQTEQRRRRLQGLHNLSAFTQQTRVQGLLSLTLEDELSSFGVPGMELGGNAGGEEFCPCKACVKKKVSPTSTRVTAGAGSAPIEKTYDLWQILRKKKESCTTSRETAEQAPGEAGIGLLQEHPSRTGSVQGADRGVEPGVGSSSGVQEGQEDEGNQKLSGVEDATLEEAEGPSGVEDAEPRKEKGAGGIEEAEPGEAEGHGGVEEAEPGEAEGLGGVEEAEPGEAEGLGGVKEAEPGEAEGPSGFDDAQLGEAEGPGGVEDAQLGEAEGPVEEAEAGETEGPGGVEEAEARETEGPGGVEDAKPGEAEGPGGVEEAEAGEAEGPGGVEDAQLGEVEGPGGVEEAEARETEGPGGVEEAEAGEVEGPGGIADAQLGEVEGADYQEVGKDSEAQKRQGKTDTESENDLEEEESKEQGVNEKEENITEGSEDEDSLKDETSGRDDQEPGGEGDGADAMKAQEADRNGQTESESYKDNKPPFSPREVSENHNSEQEERPASSPGLSEDTTHQKPAPKTVTSYSIMSSLGNCSQVSQKGSEEEQVDGDTKSIADEPIGVTHPESKVTGMYPESSSSEQEGAWSDTDTPDKKADEDPDLDKNPVKSLNFTKMTGEADGVLGLKVRAETIFEAVLSPFQLSASYTLQRLHRKAMLLPPPPWPPGPRCPAERRAGTIGWAAGSEESVGGHGGGQRRAHAPRARPQVSSFPACDMGELQSLPIC